VGFAGYALLMLGYLGEDPTARTFIESQISSGTGDMVGIAKAALLLMGKADDMTKYKADVTTGLKSSSTFVAVASAAALGIAAKDDAAVTGTLIPLVKWTEPDTSDDGKGMFAAHVLGLVAWDRRGWVGNGGDTGPVTFYGDIPGSNGGAVGAGGMTGAGGVAGSGGAAGGGSGSKDASPNDAKQGTGGAVVGGATGKGGVSGTSGTTGAGSAPGAGGAGGAGAGGVVGAGGGKPPTSVSTGGDSGGGTPTGNGGDTAGGTDATGGTNGTSPVGPADSSSGCKCNLGGSGHASSLSLFALAGLALSAARRRRR
jgi:MYXO-CTERM domain-containing protein